MFFHFAELTNDFSWYEKETIIRWLSWTPTEPIRLNNLGTNYTMKTQYKQEEGFPSGFFPFLLDFRCLVTSIFSLSLSCFGSAVDLEKVLEFIAGIWIFSGLPLFCYVNFQSLSVLLWICSRSRKGFRVYSHYLNSFLDFRCFVTSIFSLSLCLALDLQQI